MRRTVLDITMRARRVVHGRRKHCSQLDESPRTRIRIGVRSNQILASSTRLSVTMCGAEIHTKISNLPLFLSTPMRIRKVLYNSLSSLQGCLPYCSLCAIENTGVLCDVDIRILNRSSNRPPTPIVQKNKRSIPNRFLHYTVRFTCTEVHPRRFRTSCFKHVRPLAQRIPGQWRLVKPHSISVSSDESRPEILR
jgi:hypothetical protein